MYLKYYNPLVNRIVRNEIRLSEMEMVNNRVVNSSSFLIREGLTNYFAYLFC